MQSFDEVRAALDELTPDAALEGPWSLGVALSHCAQSIELSMTGYPELKGPLFRATIGPLAKRRFLSKGEMSHDTAAPVAGAPDIPEDTSASVGMARLLAAMAAFEAFDGTPADHLAYGPCTKDEYQALHAIHVADHLRTLKSG